ncbi:MAG TPA: hypothetical protein DCL80_12155 [Balneola sp.]|nr:hypothetical protein [Balneola sp.]MBF66061.1 hypothetical protein [Balneola sp.]HAH51957.1 hypothetical protein [Balneola sp.]
MKALILIRIYFSYIEPIILRKVILKSGVIFLNKGTKTIFSPILSGFLVGIFVFCIGLMIASLRYQVLIQHQERESKEVLELVEQNIERTIQESYSAALTLALTVNDEGEVKNFNKIAETLYKNSNVVDVLELVPDGIIKYVYPLEGNESVIGYDILSDPKVNAEVLKAAELGNIYFAGPISLKQGGQAVIGRLPITIDEEIWGYSAILIYLETLIEESGIHQFSKDRYYFQLSKVNPNTGEEEFFLPVNKEVELNSYSSINFPEGDWRLYTKRIDVDFAETSFLVIALSSLLGGLLCGFITTKFLRRPKELEELLKQNTEKLLLSKEKFRKNSELLQSILESPQDMIIFSLDTNYNYLAFTTSHKKMMKKLWGQDIELGKNMIEYVPDQEIKKQLKTDFDRALRGEHFDYIQKYGNKNFPDQYWENRFVPIMSKDNSVVGLTLYVTNITDRVEAEKEITLEKQISDSIINSLPGVFYLYNKEGKFYRWNKNFEEVVGYTAQEMEEAHPLNFFDENEKELLAEKIGNVFISGEDNVEANFVSKDGTKTPYYFTGAAINYKGEECLLGVGLDISNQKNIEKEINLEKQLSDSLINSLPGVFYLFTKEGKYLRWNKNFETVTGFTSEEMETAHPINFFDVDEKELLAEKIGNVFVEGTDSVEANFMMKDGSKIPYFFTGVAVNYNGEECLLGVGIDISERKKAEQKHSEVLQQLQSHLYNSPLGVVEYNSDLNITTWSKRCELIFGWTEQEVLGKNAFDLIYEQDKSKTEIIADELTKGSVDSNISHNRNYTKSGKIIDCVWYNTVVKNSSGEITTVMSLVEDITEKKKSEEIIENSLKEKTTLLSEIHHRVKNNLAIVSGLLQLQKNEVKDEKVTAAFEQSINRIISIAMVHELMYKSPELSSVNIHTYLDMLIPAIAAAMNDHNRNIEFKIEIDEYKLNINQAIPIGLLLNELITNSFKYAFQDQNDGYIKIELSSSEQSVTILYEDNGSGFGEESNFDKPKNLGLNLIHTQLQQLDATYKVDTENKFKLEFTFESETYETIER